MTSEKRKRLWDVDHPYFCRPENFHCNGCSHTYGSVDEFMSDHSSDPDLNLLFRWDWRTPRCDDGYGENEVVELFFVKQRKGAFFSALVMISPDREERERDEQALHCYIKARWDHMRLLWSPFSGVDE